MKDCDADRKYARVVRMLGAEKPVLRASRIFAYLFYRDQISCEDVSAPEIEGNKAVLLFSLGSVPTVNFLLNSQAEVRLVQIELQAALRDVGVTDAEFIFGGSDREAGR